ncbi:Cellulosome-anchoring protein precursor [compost metagenome]
MSVGNLIKMLTLDWGMSMLLSRKYHSWKQKLAVILALALPIGNFSSMVAPQQAAAAPTTVTPGGVADTNLTLWLKADAGVSTAAGSNTLTGWADQIETNANSFTVNGAPKKQANVANFNPAITFDNTTPNTQSPNVYLKGNKSITYKDGYAVFKNRAGTIVGSTAPTGNYGSAIFTNWSGKLWVGNGENGKYNGISYNDSSRFYMASMDVSNAAAVTGSLNGVPQAVDNRGNFSGILFTPVIGGTFGGGSNNNWDHLKGDVAEVILFSESTAGNDRKKIESYLALKYGLTLNSDYMDSAGATIWSTNPVYGHRITGIGRDDQSGLYQKQSKSQDVGALVTLALGNSVQETNADNSSTAENLSFMTFGDNNGSMNYDSGTKLMGRVFQAGKTSSWTDQNVTLELDASALHNDASATYLLIDDNAGFASPDKIKLDAHNRVTINSSLLASGALFTFQYESLNIELNQPENEAGAIPYRQGDGEVKLAPSTTITGGGTFSDGNLTFSLENGRDASKKGSTTSEKLSLVKSAAALTDLGAVSIVGDKVYLGDGSAAKQIGSINAAKNGVGKDLQIDFATPLVNGDFSSGTTGWTINNKAVTLGPELAPKTQGKPVTVSGSSIPYTVSGSYSVAGVTYNYSFPTDINYSGAYGLNEGKERLGTGSGSFVSAIESGALKLESKSISLKSGSNTGNAYGSIFGPEAISSPFTAKQGEQLAFDWKAQGGGDNYEIYGYLVDASGKHTELMYGRGGTQAWTKASGLIPADGTYRFRFVSGSYDKSGGYALGAALFIDNVRVLNNDVTADVVSAIAGLVTYENSPLPKPLNDNNNLRKVIATVTNAEGKSANDHMFVKLVADAVSGAPGGVAGAAVWLKADDGATATAAGKLNGWEDKTGNHVFTLDTPSKLDVVPAKANFYPAVVFSGGKLESQYGVTIKEAFAVGKHSNKTGDASLAAPKNSGTYNSLFRGNSGNTYSQFIQSNGNVGLTLSNGTLNPNNSLNLLSASAPAGKAWANGLLGERKVPGFNAVDSRQLLVGSRSDGNGRMQGPVAELIIYENALEDWDRLKVNSYLALKYGLTLKTEDGNATNYAASDATNLTDGTKMWTAGKNNSYGNRITGIGRDDKGALHQKQSKSQEDGGLVAIAIGNDVKTDVQDNVYSISRNMTFFTFSDDNASVDYSKNISTPQAGNNLKLMDRVFKVDKTNWLNTDITFQLGNGGQSDLTYLVIGSEPTFKNAPAAFIPLNANGKVTINTVNLGDGEYFSFAHVNRDALIGKVTAVAGLNQHDYTPANWLTLQNALTHANAVLNNPASTQAEIDAAWAALELARLGEGTTVHPGGVNGASLWLKADGGATAAAGLLTSWADQTGKNTFTVNGTPDYQQGSANFNPAVTFNNTSSYTQSPNEYLRGNTAITYQSGYAVFKQKAGTVVGSTAPIGSYGAGIFTKWAGKLWAGNGSNGTYHGFSFNDASRYYLAGFDSSNVSSPVGRLNGAGQTVQKNGAFGQIAFTPVIGGTFGGGSSNNWDHYKGEIAEIILFPTSKTAADQQKVESYLALKYGLTLNNGGTDYLTSNGISTMWTTSANQGFGKRITGIGRDDGSVLMQKQSKSQESGALVTLAQGNTIASSVQENMNTIDRNLSFLTFSDNGASAAYTGNVTEAVYYGLNMNLMNRTFKVEKTNWQEGLVTLKLDGADVTGHASPEQYYLLISANADLSAPQFIGLDTSGKVTIDSSILTHGSYFTFAKTHKDVLKAQTALVASLNNDDGRYESASWLVLQDALNAAQAVLNNPHATQYQIDDALDYLKTALEALGSTKPPLKAKIDDILVKIAPNTGSYQEPDYTARSWSVLTATYGVAQNVYGETHPYPTVTYGAALSALELAELGLIDLRPLKAEKASADAKLAAANATSTPGPYTEASWQALQDALAAANALLSRALDPLAEVTQAEVDAAKLAVEYAKNGLQKIDKSALQEAKDRIIAENLTAGVYTAASWDALQAALTTANAVLADPNATEAQVEAARLALDNAIKGLQVDKTSLQEAKNRITAESLTAGAYTPASWNVLQAALTAATAVLTDPNATATQVEDALKALNAARSGLVLVDNSGSGNSGTGTGSSGTTTTTPTTTTPPIKEEVVTAKSHVHYINGYPDGLIRPEGSATRAEIATMLANLGAAQNVSIKDGFPDVDDSHWAAESIKRVKAAGLMKGYLDGNFKPEGTITRAEMAAIIFNYSKLNQTKKASFTDVTDTHWANPIIAAVQDIGVLSGYADGTFQPDQALTRAEAVTALNRLFNRGPLYNIPNPSWPDLNVRHWAYLDMEEASRDHSYKIRPEGGETWLSH